MPATRDDAVAHELGVGIAGAHRVDGDAARGGLGRERAREADERVLCRAIGRDIRVAFEAGGGCDIDDAAEAALDHARQHRLACIDRAHEVDVPHGAEHGWVGLGEGAGLDRPGIVHQDGNGTAGRFGGGHLALDLDHVGDVGHAAARGVAGVDRLAQRRFGAADHGHDGAGARERGGDRAADAATAAGDESMLAVERHGVPLARPGIGAR